MATHNVALWQTVTFLFLSKFSPQANQPFAQKMLINAKNVDLAQKFAEMVGDTTESGKIKLALLKALKQMEKQGFVERIDENTIQISPSGAEKMTSEVEAAMRKIAESFPDTSAAKKQTPTAQ